MKELKSLLTERIDNKSPLRIWHVLIILALVAGAIPIPNLAQPLGLALGILSIVGYFWANRLIKRAARASTIDIVLVDRFFILMGWLYLAAFTLLYGLRHGFSSFTSVALVALAIVLICLLLGIVLHIKNAHKYYHGVRKDELFK